MMACAVLLIVLPIVLNTINTDIIGSTDWVYRHTIWIDHYLQGSIRPIFDYPPLFHWLMAPFVAINFPMKWMQVVFSVLTISGILFYLKKCESEKMMMYSLMMLATSVTFVEYAGSLMPQGLDYFIVPFMLYFYFRGKDKYTILLGLFISGMHMTGQMFLFMFFIHSLVVRKKNWKIYLVVLILLTPIFIYYSYGTWLGIKSDLQVIQMQYDMEAQMEWDSQYFQPINFIIYSGFLAYILLPYAVKNLWKGGWKLTDKEKFYLIWILSVIPIGFGGMGMWRMISYQVVPIIFLIGSLVAKE